MKKLLIALAAVALSAAVTYGQGAVAQVVFANRVTGLFDAPVMYGTTGHGPGPDYSSGLYLVGANGVETLLTPTTVFRAAGTGTAAIADRYFSTTPTIDLPASITPGANADFIVKTWKTSLGSYDAALASKADYGASTKFTVAAGGGTLPPANLTTLTGFTVVAAVPEPSIIALGVLGASALLLRRRK
jgi:hypothetical protein